MSKTSLSDAVVTDYHGILVASNGEDLFIVDALWPLQVIRKALLIRGTQASRPVQQPSPGTLLDLMPKGKEDQRSQLEISAYNTLARSSCMTLNKEKGARRQNHLILQKGEKTRNIWHCTNDYHTLHTGHMKLSWICETHCPNASCYDSLTSTS